METSPGGKGQAVRRPMERVIPRHNRRMQTWPAWIGAHSAASIRTGVAACVGAIALSVLVGWAFDAGSLKSVLPGLATMKVNTALGLLAGAVGVALLDGRRRAWPVVLAAALLLAALGALSLIEYAAHLNLGIDELLVADLDPASRPFNGRMSPATGIGFVALGIGLGLLGAVPARAAAWAGHMLALVPAAIGFLSLAGYAYGVGSLYDLGPFESVALHTGVGLLLLALGLLLARQGDGWARGLVGRPIARGALLRIAGLAVTVPFAAGLLIVAGIRAGYYQAQFAPSVFALVAAGALLRLAFRSAHVLASAEAEVQRMSGQLARSRSRHQAVIEGLPQLVWTCLPDGRCDYLSRQWIEYTGLPEAEQLGLAWLGRVIHPDDAARTLDHWMGAVAGKHPYDIEYRIRGGDGAYRWFKVRGVQVPGDDGAPYWFGTCTDIEEIVVARESLAASRQSLEDEVAARTGALMAVEEQLRQSQKMEAVGQLTGGLAHDFNNLLTGISGSLELLLTRLKQGRVTELERYVSAAQGGAARAAALTHRLLAFARRQTLAPKPTDTNRLVAGLEDLVRRTVGPGIAVEVVAAGGLWPVLVDPPQLESALLNLAINARDAMPGGGKLTIETANRWLDERAAQEHEVPAGQYVSVCVSDTGAGMAPEVAARAFDPFFTTKPIGQGTGLGLSMIYGFVQQSGGQARIYSEPGFGTAVRLYFPRHTGLVGEEAVTPQAPPPRAEPGQTVLVIDDEPTIRGLVTEVLHELGYAALEARDGPTGLEILRSDARIDLLVTDVGLPGGLNGRQVADAARLARPGLKVLFMTGFAENAVFGHGHVDAGMHVLTKPFPMEAMARRIQELLAAGPVRVE